MQTLDGKTTNKLVVFNLRKMAERSEAKSLKRRVVSKKVGTFDANLRFALPFLPNSKCFFHGDHKLS